MKRRYVVRDSPIHGRGVFANVDLPAGVALMEYEGARIPRAEARRRDAALTASGHTYLFDINDDWVIDGSEGGNAARFVNHGCEPNLEPLIHVNVDGDARRDKVLFHTLRPIRAGEELTFDYGIVLAVPHTARMKRLWACRCGAKTCRGTMLAERPEDDGPTPTEKKMKSKLPERILDVVGRAARLGRDALAAAAARYPAGIMEPAFRTEDGELAVEGRYDLPCRADVIESVDEDGVAGDSVMVDANGVGFQPFEERVGALTVAMQPFTWDYAGFTVKGSARFDVARLCAWFMDWFDGDDENEEAEDGLHDVVHYLSDPKSRGRTMTFTVDFGSAPPDAFRALLQTLAAMGAEHVTVGRLE